jgi:hypothetical protein
LLRPPFRELRGNSNRRDHLVQRMLSAFCSLRSVIAQTANFVAL